MTLTFDTHLITLIYLFECLKTNILYYIEHTLSHYWFYGPVMSLPMWDGVFPLKKYECVWPIA